MTELALSPANFHETVTDDRRVCWHVSSGALFEVNDLGGALLDFYSDRNASMEEACNSLGDDFDTDQIIESIEEFKALEILQPFPAEPTNRLPQKVEEFPISTIVLNVNTACNLSCTYCYKEDLDKPNAGKKMSFETARDSIDMLLKESPDRDRYNIVFFGGEPLTHMPLIRQVVDYCEQKINRELGKWADFSMTTNATMLTEELVDYFQAHNFCITISMDGPEAVHDKNRITVSGQGTYAVVAEKTQMLLSKYRARPVGGRVTLTKGVTDIVGIWDHLFNALGFAEVGFSPVTSGDVAYYNLSDEELTQVFAGMKSLGKRYLDAALRNENIGFANLHQLMTDLHEGTSNALPCGAGVSLLAVDKDGGLNLCHRFTGSEMPLFGDVKQGIDKENLASFLEQRLDRSNQGCSSCWIRNLCSGGCYHESYARYNDPAKPVYHYCDLMRDWIDFGIGVYQKILSENPAFFDQHISPRKAA
ncbi:MAG: thioether cross-link-forming SCIFF peptide maturase [Candidatus Pelagadaptatus aseana]|uniref:quinohemoprotein amine dehydrogenase maturation protein n=1 Tax=Candidatus Pelagadaptatus aseana TaxID=3120508 RepID=UPI0039B2B65D